MQKQQSALAFARAYQLFSQIYQHGLTAETAALLDISKTDAHFGAAHYQLFVHNVYPYETIFLGDDGLLGGNISERVAAFYQRIGFHSNNSDNTDHLSTELSAMAYLCFAELDAIEDQVPHQAERLRQLQRRFLDEHLLRWLPAFVIAVEQQGKSVYTDVVRQSFELVCTHRTQLGDDLMAADEVFSLPQAPDLLANEKTSLRDIAHYLLTPAYTGFFVSFSDIKRLGTKFRAPHGFGKRHLMLTNLLRTASDYDVFPDVIADFGQVGLQWQQKFKAMDLLPESIQQIWTIRLASTLALLNKIEKLAHAQKMIISEEETEHGGTR